MNITVLDVILGVCLLAAIGGVVLITYSGHDVAAVLSIATALIGLLGGKKISPGA